MQRSPVRVLKALAVLGWLLVVIGCGGATSSGQSETPFDVPSLVAPSIGPPDGSASPNPPSVPPTSEAPLTEHPVARIATGLTSAVDGVIGGWTLDAEVFEQSWIDLADLKRTDIPADELVFAGFGDGTPIGAWSARIARVSDATGATAVDAGSGSAGGADFVTIGRIAAGTWILEVTLTRADGRGEATYYWEILAE
jgi:hypothetical protein